MLNTQPQQEAKKRSGNLPIILKLSLISVIFSTFLLSYLPGGNVINKYIGIVFAVIVVSYAFFKWKRLHISSELILMYLWCLYGLIISIYAKNSMLSFNKAMTMFQLAILLMCSASVIIWSKNIRFFMYIFVVAALVSYMSSLTFFSGIMVGKRVVGVDDARVLGTLRDPNRFGIAMIEVQFVILYLLATSKKKREVFLLLGGLILFGISVVQSGSRTALLGMISVVVFGGWAFSIYNPKKHLNRSVTTLIVLATLIVIAYIKVSNDAKLMERYLIASEVIKTGDLSAEGEWRSHSLQSRYAFAKLAWQLAIEHPFGIGFANFSYYAGTFAHSNYFEILSCTGFPGFILYYTIYIVLFLKAFKISFSGFESVEERRLALSFPLIIAVLDIGLVNYYSKDFWLLVSLISANLALVKNSKAKSD